MSTEYILEYCFLHDDGTADEWSEVDSFYDGREARIAYWEHIKEFKHAQCRIRETKVITHVEERVVAEYSLGEF